MAVDTTEDALLQSVRAHVGRAAPPRRALDAVNAAMIRHWCEAIGDRVPDDDVAPSHMLGIWTMRGLRPPPAADVDPRRRVFQMLEDAGFVAVVATNLEQEYLRRVRAGEVVTEVREIESISERKETGLGTGYFVSERSTFTTDDGEVVGIQRARYLKYAPKPRPADPGRRPRPAMNQDSAFFWEGAARGELLVQRCGSCGALRHPPHAACPSCRSFEWEPARMSGRGEVYSFVVSHHPPVPGFRAPYVVGLIQLEEGPRLISNVIEVDPPVVRVGMPVEVRFVAVDDELTLPLFVPREDA